MSRKECGKNDAVLPDSLAHGKENRILACPPPFVVKMSTPQSSPEEKLFLLYLSFEYLLLLACCKMVAGEKEGSHAKRNGNQDGEDATFLFCLQ